MSEAMPIVPKSWRLESGEEVLREQSVDTEERDRNEIDNPVRRIGWSLVFLVAGLFFFVRRGPEFLAGQVDWTAYLGIVLGAALIALSIWMLTRRRAPSAWAAMSTFVFTKTRVVLLDGQRRLLDEIRLDEIEDVVLIDYGVSIIRKDDPELTRMFGILYVPDPDELFEFVRDTYT
ncbi:MAG: hypothetical protein VX501_04110 [Pseudomonadota bacterium]|nr:hypothetical protein [Pseudomonadota bacterium]